MTTIYRQGDVLVRKISDQTDAVGTPETRDEHGRVVLAHGEVTGHAHTFRGDGVAMTARKADGDTLVLDRPKTLNHEHVSGQKAEHDPITFDAGQYEIAAQFGYTPQELRREVD